MMLINHQLQSNQSIVISTT